MSKTGSHAIYTNIQGLRAIAAILVMLCHIAYFAPSLGFESFATPFGYFGFIGVDLFFVISGVVVTVATYSHLGQRKYIFTFARKRAVRIYSNYWVILLFPFGLIGLGVFQLGPEIGVWESVFLLPQAHSAQIIPVAWTLVYEMFFYVVFVFIILFPQRFFILLITSWFCLILLVNLFWLESVDAESAGYQFYFSAYQLEFISGCFVGWMSIKKFSIFPKAFLCLGGLTVLATTLFTMQEPTLNNGLDTFSHVHLYGSGVVMVVYGFVLLEVKNGWRMPRWISSLGNSSYTLYLVHNTIFPMLIHMVYRPFLEEKNSVFLQQSFIAFSILMIAGYSVLHYRVIEKPLLNWCNNLFKHA